MPKLVFTNPGVQDSVTRPVVLDVIRQLLKWTGLPRDTQIQFPGENGKVPQPGSTITAEEEFNFFNTHTQWTIEVEERAQEDRGLSMAVFQEENVHVLWDGDTRVYLKPAYSATDVIITIRHRATDKDRMTRWREEMRTRVAMGREARVHDVKYSYLIPLEYIPILEEIHRMREAVAPYGEDFEAYMARYTSTKVRKLSTLAGTELVWGVAEAQARILGYFDFELIPDKGDKGSEDSTSSTSVTYTFKYDKPVASVLEYPLMVHNQLMIKKYRPTALPPRIEDNKLSYSLSSRALASWESYRASEGLGHQGIGIPEFDEFMPAKGSVPIDTIRLVTGLTGIDPENPRDLLQLDQLGDHDIDPDVLVFMRGEGAAMVRHGASLVHVSVYRHEYLMSPSDFTITPELMVRLNEPANLRDVYHVRVSLYERPRLLPIQARERMRRHCTATRKILYALNPDLEKHNALPTCLPGNILPKADLDKALGIMDLRHDTQYNGQVYQFNTVATLMIAATRIPA